MQMTAANWRAFCCTSPQCSSSAAAAWLQLSTQASSTRVLCVLPPTLNCLFWHHTIVRAAVWRRRMYCSP